MFWKEREIKKTRFMSKEQTWSKMTRYGKEIKCIEIIYIHTLWIFYIIGSSASSSDKLDISDQLSSSEQLINVSNYFA